MLELKTKWMSNTLAKASMLNKDGIVCENGNMLFIVGYGVLTTSGKNTYNYEVRDNNNNVISSGNDTYLDKLTTIIKGVSPKAKANKETNESEVNKPKKQTKNANECLYLTFDEAFNKACKEIEAYKKVAIELDKYSEDDAIKLTLIILNDARIKERERIKEAKKSEELKSLRQTLELAKVQGNTMLVDAIKEMISNKENE